MDFTDILNKGIRMYIDKHTKKRIFDECDICSNRCLLINWVDKNGDELNLCNSCYEEALK